MFSITGVIIWVIASSGLIISYFLYSFSHPRTTNTFTFASNTKSAFQTTRLTESTFLVKEYNDIFSEHPHIYAKIIPSAHTIILIDTGCGGATNDPEVQIKNLRQYIETVRIEENGGQPLNGGGKLQYVVITTHCHYDHILGIDHFKDMPILASSYSPELLSPSVISEHSLCNALGLKMPSYTPTLVPHLYKIKSAVNQISVGVTVLHTPGHTPDELALYDQAEMMLYVGDSLYEYEPIIFPREGSIVTWFASIDFLITFVKQQNQDLSKSMGIKYNERQVLINAGHRTVLRPALEVLLDARNFMQDIVMEKERVVKRTIVRGEETVIYEQSGGRFSLRCPERLVLEARNARLDY